jgi:hypothetical protein
MADWKQAALEVARKLHHRDGAVEIDIDNDTADDAFSEAEDGIWVRAWVFVPDTELGLTDLQTSLDASAEELSAALRRTILSAKQGGQPAPEDAAVLDRALNEVLRELGALVS